MPVHQLFVINRAGSLIHDFDASVSTRASQQVDKTFSYPLPFRLEMIDQRATVTFGESDGVKIGYSILGINGEPVSTAGKVFIPPRTQKNSEGVDEVVSEQVVDILDFVADKNHYPLAIKFGRPPLTTNEKIILSSMFHSLHAIAAQLSPATTSSGIHSIDADQFTLHCFQTMTGVKFVAVADAMTANLDQLLRRIYEFYSDYALKNPFYSMDMPIRCELFDTNLQSLVDRFNKSGVLAV